VTVLRLGTRASALALAQAQWVAGRLRETGAAVEIHALRTEGDRAFGVDLASAGGAGLFTREIERALLEERIDVAVHSLKDLPTAMPEGLAIAAIPPRADPGDLLLVRPDALDASAPFLPVRARAIVGTGAPRRIALLRHVRPDLVTGSFRGNVPTRVEKCRLGEVDAVILARAGLSRLGLDLAPLVTFDLDAALWIPAPAQGALAIQVRAGDARTLAAASALDDAMTRACVDAERDLLRLLLAGCHAALGALATLSPHGVLLKAGMWAEDAWRSVAVEAAAHLAAEGAAEALRAATAAHPPPPTPAPPWCRPAASLR
jgi:hydroxymethylbilane synthase